MSLDARTLSLLLCLQLLVLALTLSLIAGPRVSGPLRWAVGGLWAQLSSWVLIGVAPWLGAAATTLSYAIGALSFTMTLQALQGWLGPRPGLRLSWAIPPAMAVVYLAGELLHNPEPLQRGATNALMALNLLLLVNGLLRGAASQGRRWRRVFAFPLLLLALLTGWRALTGFGIGGEYPALAGGHPVVLALMVIGNLATLIGALAFLAAWRGEAEAQLREAALSDPLTGLANRRGLEQRAAALLASARRHRRPLSALLIDIDFFKQINDRHGHAAGDAALALLGEQLRQVVRAEDLVARLGGEEFALLLPDSEAVEALDRRLRDALRAQAPARLGFALDFSAGWARLRDDDRDVHTLLGRADAALYRAKHGGRGRLCFEEEEHGSRPQPG